MAGGHLFVVTGASRGLGAAMAEQLLLPGHQLLCISRRDGAALAAKASSLSVALEQWTADLAHGAAVAERLHAWLAQIDGAAFTSVTLINNAAMLTRITPLADSDAAELATAMRINLEAPMLLTAAFLNATSNWPAARRVLNISSGLGRRAMASQAPYCAAKAGLDHLTRCVALDEALRPNGARIVSIAPGVIDTDMQAHLRAAEPAGFPDQANFKQLKANGQLTSSADAAARLLAYLARPDFGSAPVADVREA